MSLQKISRFFLLLLFCTACSPSFKSDLIPIARFTSLDGQVNVPKVAAVGSLVYVVDDKAGFSIWDLQDPKNPKQIGSRPEKFYNISHIGIQGSYLIVNDERVSMLFDISNPKEPKPPVSMWFHQGTNDLIVKDDWIYHTNWQQGLSATPLVSDSAYDAAVHNMQKVLDDKGNVLMGSVALLQEKYLVVLSYSHDLENNFFIWDLSAPDAQIIYKAKINAYLGDILIDGSIAYMSSPDKGLYVFDLSDPLKPKQIAHMSGLQSWDLSLFNKTLLVQENARAIYTIDVSNPAKPKALSKFETQASGVAALSDDTFVVGSFDGVTVVKRK